MQKTRSFQVRLPMRAALNYFRLSLGGAVIGLAVADTLAAITGHPAVVSTQSVGAGVGVAVAAIVVKLAHLA
jgi:hypothetical protein